MAQIAEISYNVQGDIGGVGISRFWFAPQTPGNVTGSQVNAAAAAARALLFAAAAYIPTPVTWTCNAQSNVYDPASGLVQGPLVVSSLPATVTGTGGNTFAAGVGARINWKTSTLSGRRLVRGALFLAPLASSGFSSAGAVANPVVTALNAAVATYLSALTTASLYPIVWHRPAKGTFTGGLQAIVFAGVCSSVPASLRSRRN
jgi:hypothetical protein